MTRDSDFKKLVRQQMAATGQSYTEARAALHRSAADADLPLSRRAFGLKTSYTAVFDGGQAPGERGAGEYKHGAGEQLFRQAAGPGQLSSHLPGKRCSARPASWGVRRGSAGVRHPECDSIVELVAAQRAGDEILLRLAAEAERSLAGDGSPAAVTVSRAVTAQSESYLVASAVAPERYLRLLEPFLATRWVCGAPRTDDRGGAPAAPRAAMAARAFADQARYQRLKITDTGPGHCELDTFVRAGATEQVLRLAESATAVSADYHGDASWDAAVRIQRAYLAAARRARHRRPEDDVMLDAWQAALDRHGDDHDGAGRPQADIPIVTAPQIETAVGLPPQTTRARLRGLFIKTGKEYRRTFTVDWTHLRLNDGARRTVLCWNPLDAHLEIAERLITSIEEGTG